MGWKLPVLLAMSFASPAAAQGLNRFEKDADLRIYADSVIHANFQRTKESVQHESGQLSQADYWVTPAHDLFMPHDAIYEPENNTIYFFFGSFKKKDALRIYKKQNRSLTDLTQEMEAMTVHEVAHSAMYRAIKENNCEWWKSARFKDNFERDLWKLLIEGYADFVTEQITGKPLKRGNYEINDSLLTQPQNIHWNESQLYAAGLAFFRGMPPGPKTLDALLSTHYTEADYFALPALRERILKQINSGGPITCEQP